jgi:Molybdopterin biosynthesis enzyme
MLSVAEVWQRLDSLAAPLAIETVPLALAAGRVLRTPITALEDQPAFDRSSIDGYVAPLSTSSGATLRLVGEIPVGQPAPDFPQNPDVCLKLFTGSAVPAGPLGLVMHEDTTPAAAPDGARTITLRAAPSVTLIRRRASQCRAGDRLLPAGTVLNPGALALLASLGQTAPAVSCRARVAHLVTGGEIVPAENTPAPGQIRDSNSTLIAALLAATGVADLVAHARADEAHASADSAFARLLSTEPDLLLVSGGSSGGEHDHTARLFAEHGFTLSIERVASRPGKPLLVATRGAQIAVGLPGNPLSHFVCFHLFVARILARLTGTATPPLARVPLAPGALLRSHPRETWWPAARTPEGYAPLPWADSSDLTVLSRTHALLRVPSSAAPETTADALLV